MVKSIDKRITLCYNIYRKRKRERKGRSTMRFNLTDDQKAILIDMLDYFWDSLSEDGIISEDTVENITPYETLNTYFDFQFGASKAAFVPRTTEEFPYVVKIPYNWDTEEADWFQINYCQEEADLAAAIEEAGLDETFLITEYYGKYNNWPIYLQEKASPEEKMGDASSDERKGLWGFLMRNGFSQREIDVSWNLLAQLDILYGEEYLLTFCKFVRDHRLNDISAGNYSYIAGVPKVFDYAGYRGSYEGSERYA